MNRNYNRFKLAVMLSLISMTLLLPVNSIQPTLLLPIESTKGVTTEYSIGFIPEETVPHSAKIKVIFPFEFDPRALINYSDCKLQRATGTLSVVPCSISNRTFTLEVGTIALEATTVVIGNILNPSDGEMSSQFIIQTLFKQVTVEVNEDFGRTPFTNTPSILCFI